MACREIECRSLSGEMWTVVLNPDASVGELRASLGTLASDGELYAEGMRLEGDQEPLPLPLTGKDARLVVHVAPRVKWEQEKSQGARHARKPWWRRVFVVVAVVASSAVVAATSVIHLAGRRDHHTAHRNATTLYVVDTPTTRTRAMIEAPTTLPAAHVMMKAPSPLLRSLAIGQLTRVEAALPAAYHEAKLGAVPRMLPPLSNKYDDPSVVQVARAPCFYHHVRIASAQAASTAISTAIDFAHTVGKRVVALLLAVAHTALYPFAIGGIPGAGKLLRRLAVHKKQAGWAEPEPWP